MTAREQLVAYLATLLAIVLLVLIAALLSRTGRSLEAVGVGGACMYWDRNKLNALADADDVERVTRKINGGVNGLADRKALLVKAKGLVL